MRVFPGEWTVTKDQLGPKEAAGSEKWATLCLQYLVRPRNHFSAVGLGHYWKACSQSTRGKCLPGMSPALDNEPLAEKILHFLGQCPFVLKVRR